MRTRKYKGLQLDFPVIKKLSAEIWQHNKIYKSGKYPTWRILHRGGGKITTNGYTFLYDDDATTMSLPAHMILNKIRKGQYHCIFFKLFLHDFMQAFNVESMYGKEWCIPLQNGQIVSCEEDNLSISCKHPEKGWLIPADFIKQVTQEQYTLIKQKVQIPDILKKYILEKNNTIKY